MHFAIQPICRTLEGDIDALGKHRQPARACHHRRVSRVAFIGLGGMGSRMARRLIDAGHDVVVWNRTRDRTEPLVDIGAEVAESPAAAARSVEAVLTMVADPRALRAVTEGDDGVAAGVSDATVMIEMSTVGPAAVERLVEVLPARAEVLDAPVLGSLTEAETGALKIFVGGPEQLVSKWTPLLATLGLPMHVGPLGSGAAAKLVANSTLLVTLGMIGEALALGGALGLSRDATFEILAQTPIAAQAQRRRPQVENDDYPHRFSLSLARKDADVITQAAGSSGAKVRVVDAVRSWFADAEVAGEGDHDYSAILAYIIRAAAEKGSD
jgi:3-hydroxyisobutyrate dehydrogenase-like beta-hydroxyacid dehydrogenase